jgi:hypothetical protein
MRLRALAARNEIASGAMRGDAFLRVLMSVPIRDRDAWVDTLLDFENPPDDVSNLPRGSVPYLPAGVEEVLAMIESAPLTSRDHLVDLGAGLGRVAILAHLITGARAHGVEIQEPLVRATNACRDALNLPAVTFEHANAVDVALDGSHFFLYAPFNGPMLAAVLQRVRDVARRRSITLCTVGLELDDVSWLARRRSETTVSLAIYDSI